MNSAHLWFRSGPYSLLGHLDASPQRRGNVGAIIVPPFGWEDVSAYRPLRFLARALAQAGIPTLRYDLPGTGDSSGDALDPGLFEAWIQSIGDAANELRQICGVEEVAVIGVHLGAMLAVLAADRGADVQQLVLWGGAATGRSLLRELRATANMERWESLPPEQTPPQPFPGLETGGFLLSSETQQALENLDLSQCSLQQCRRILLLSRDDLPHDARLVSALENGLTLKTAPGRGYSAMMTMPHEALPAEETNTLIVEFLTQGAPSRPAPRHHARPRNAAHQENDFTESIYTVDSPPLHLFGVLTEPARGNPRSESCILYLNPGGARHTGPNRMWVESARRWAARGVPSLRLDLQGIGESEGSPVLDIPALYQARLVDQIELAIDRMEAHLGVRRFVAVGLCAGAFWAFHAALRTPEIRAAILLNPRLFFWDPAADQRRMLRRTARGLTRWADWSRLLRGGVRLNDIKRMARAIARPHLENDSPTAPETLAHAWEIFEQSQQRMTVVFREGEPLLKELEDSGQLPASPFVRCIRLPNGGHTFRPMWAQKMAHELIDQELAAAIPDAVLAEQAHV